jgi:hypothetical protein
VHIDEWAVCGLLIVLIAVSCILHQVKAVGVVDMNNTYTERQKLHGTRLCRHNTTGCPTTARTGPCPPRPYSFGLSQPLWAPVEPAKLSWVFQLLLHCT